MRKKSPITANPGALKALVATTKHDTRLIGEIERHLMAKHEEPSERDMTRLHPSEMAKADWCPRESYYRISGAEADSGSERAFSWVLENVFNEGHDSHHKWQMRVHDLGRLRGIWKCLHCGCRWPDTSPTECVECGSPSVGYREVPLESEKYHIIGHADGDIAEGNADASNDPLMEIKTIGLGTIRWEAPGLLADHTHRVEINGTEKTVIDYDGIWRDIKRPFPSHLRQGMLYLHLTGRKVMVFIYDCKWNQQVKEFVVRYRPEVVEPLLDAALDVKYHLKIGRPIDRPNWAEQDCKTCRACPYFTTCWSADDQEPRPEPDPDRSEAAPGAGRRIIARRPPAGLRTP